MKHDLYMGDDGDPTYPDHFDLGLDTSTVRSRIDESLATETNDDVLVIVVITHEEEVPA